MCVCVHAKPRFTEQQRTDLFKYLNVQCWQVQRTALPNDTERIKHTYIVYEGSFMQESLTYKFSFLVDISVALITILLDYL
jgi:hypothetical protein